MLISIQHQKGGTSKSTIAWNLAITLQDSMKKKIEVVDLDVQQTMTLNNYVRQSNKELKPLQIRTFTDAEALKEYFSSDDDSKIIIVDTGGFDSSLNRITALMSDFMLTPVSDSIIDLQGLKTYEKVLKQLSEAANATITSNVILSPIDPRKKNFSELREFIEKSENFNVFDSVLRRRTDFINSLETGKSVIEYKKDSKAAEEFQTLFKEIRKTLSI